jgi:PIN domain nuclease of toxin-antitoxin system
LKRIFELIDQSGLVVLPITTTHILANAALAFHHRDPFDRLIIAQAKSESLVVVSKDGVFEDYQVALLWDG